MRTRPPRPVGPAASKPNRRIKVMESWANIASRGAPVVIGPIRPAGPLPLRASKRPTEVDQRGVLSYGHLSERSVVSGVGWSKVVGSGSNLVATPIKQQLFLWATHHRLSSGSKLCCEEITRHVSMLKVASKFQRNSGGSLRISAARIFISRV